MIASAFQLCFRVRHYDFQVHQDGLKLNGKHQLPVYADDVNTMDGSVHTRWFKYDRDSFVCKQAALRSSCATLRE